MWCGCTLPCPRKRRSESFRKEGVRALVSVSVWQLSHRGFHVFVQGKDKILIFRAKVCVGRLLYSLCAIATTAVSMGAVARGATCLLLAATVQPVAGVVSPLVRNSALRLTPASVPRATARPRLSCPRMQSAWTTAVDEASGATYYYNEQTGESQWEAPSPQPGPPQPAAQPAYPRPAAQQTAQAVVWRMASASGWGPRFAGTYKLRLGDEEYLGRYDMDLQKPTRPWVSRKQCLVYVGADGAALTLTLTLALILTLTLTLTLTLRLTRCRWRRQPGLVRPVPAHTVARARR